VHVLVLEFELLQRLPQDARHLVEGFVGHANVAVNLLQHFIGVGSRAAHDLRDELGLVIDQGRHVDVVEVRSDDIGIEHLVVEGQDNAMHGAEAPVAVEHRRFH
jgi:hypothetical protein